MDKDLLNKLNYLNYSLIVAGIIIIFITSYTNNSNGLIALISGYSTILVAILFLCGLNIMNLMNINKNMSYYQLLYNSFPFLFIMGLIIFLICNYTIYFDKIVNSKVSDYYFIFSFLSTIFIIIQISILINSFKNNPIIKNNIFHLLNFIGSINIMIITTIFIILKYYVTDC